MIMPHVSNKTGICAQASTPSLSCSLEWLRFRSFPVWCKTLKNNEFRTKKFPNQEFLYGISSFCTLSENNSFLHVKISCFCIFYYTCLFIHCRTQPERQSRFALLQCIPFLDLRSSHGCELTLSVPI